MNLKNISYSFVFLAAFSLQASAQEVEVIVKNPGFEEPYTVMNTPPPEQKSQVSGSIADGWNEASDWASVTAEYAADTENPHGGESSQRITVSAINEGAVQTVQRIEFKANQQYVAHVWMRGTPGTAITLQLRQIDGPWTAYGQSTCRLTDEWQEFTVSGTVTTDGEGFLLFLASQPTTYWIDDAKVEMVSTPAP